MNTTEELGGYVIYVPAVDMRDVIRKLKEAGIIDIKEGKPGNPKDSIPIEIGGSWGTVRKLIEEGFINEKTHNFILNPKKDKSPRKLFCI